ncbi:hypothetical protein RRG08_051938 [Elysia crispata]|uniref:Uncharacterized protein n=1 Tax=Elysia crispata TaxID=231223 RepID=A0AAE0Y1T3_9GAST|nr:hypothetical protein RRG08_051938 [Elysia crispata]
MRISIFRGFTNLGFYQLGSVAELQTDTVKHLLIDKHNYISPSQIQIDLTRDNHHGATPAAMLTEQSQPDTDRSDWRQSSRGYTSRHVDRTVPARYR